MSHKPTFVGVLTDCEPITRRTGAEQTIDHGDVGTSAVPDVTESAFVELVDPLLHTVGTHEADSGEVIVAAEGLVGTPEPVGAEPSRVFLFEDGSRDNHVDVLDQNWHERNPWLV